MVGEVITFGVVTVLHTVNKSSSDSDDILQSSTQADSGNLDDISDPFSDFS